MTELGLPLPQARVVWPVLPLVGGMALLAGYSLDRRKDPDRVFLGVAASLLGAVFLFITLGPLTYSDLEAWWPVFVLIAGVAFLAQWAAAGFTRRETLFLGLVGLGVGGVALDLTHQLLGPDTRELLPKLWPTVLILVGLSGLLRGLMIRRPS